MFKVLGNPIKQSLSPNIMQLFASQFNLVIDYQRLLVAENEFVKIIKQLQAQQYVGLNVTTPFKNQAYAVADKTTARADIVKNANTITFKNGKILADNTDGIGFIRDIANYVNLNPKLKVLLMGAGGAAAAVAASLANENISFYLANRSLDKAEQMCKTLNIANCTIDSIGSFKHLEFDLIINATSIGLVDKSEQFNLELQATKPFCYDLIYSLTTDTPFIKWAKNQGHNCADGFGMLVEQGAESFYCWHKKFPDTATVKKIIANN